MGNRATRVRFLANAMLGYCYSCLFGANGRGTLAREQQRQVGRSTVQFHVSAEFKCQSSNCIAILSARTIINKRNAGLKGSWDFIKSIYCKLLQRQFSIRPAHPAAFPEKPRIVSHENCGYAFLQLGRLWRTYGKRVEHQVRREAEYYLGVSVFTYNFFICESLGPVGNNL